MGDHNDCVSFPYYFASLVIAILFGAVTSYTVMIMYHPALTATSASANDTEANSAPNTGISHNTGSGFDTSFGHTTGHALGFGRRSDATTDKVALVSGTGFGCHATLVSGQNFDPITVQAAAGSDLNSDHSTSHVLGFGRSFSAALGSGRCFDAALGSGRSSVATLGYGRSFDVALSSGIGSGCHATLASGQNSNFITIHVAGGFGLNSEPSIGHALGFSGLSDAALGFNTGYGCQATSDFGQNSNFITVQAAAGSSPNSEPSTGHALGSDKPFDPTTDHATLVAGIDSDCHATSDSGPSFGPTIAITTSGFGPCFGPTTVHVASCNTPTHQSAFSKDPTATFFNAAPSSSDSDDEAH